MTKQEKIEKLMKKYMFNKSEAEDAVEFVEELLDIEIEYTKEKEPYATKSIEEMETAWRVVRNMYDIFDEVKS